MKLGLAANLANDDDALGRGVGDEESQTVYQRRS
jgi:hypothetical protein